jgi:hypothetical protein
VRGATAAALQQTAPGQPFDDAAQPKDKARKVRPAVGGSLGGRALQGLGASRVVGRPAPCPRRPPALPSLPRGAGAGRPSRRDEAQAGARPCGGQGGADGQGGAGHAQDQQLLREEGLIPPRRRARDPGRRHHRTSAFRMGLEGLCRKPWAFNPTPLLAWGWLACPLPTSTSVGVATCSVPRSACPGSGAGDTVRAELCARQLGAQQRKGEGRGRGASTGLASWAPRRPPVPTQFQHPSTLQTRLCSCIADRRLMILPQPRLSA